MSGATAAALIAAGGTGERFGREAGKQLASVAGRPVLGHTVAAFDAAESIGEIVVVCHPSRVDEFATAIAPYAPNTALIVVAGGDARQDSVRAGLDEIDESWPVVVVHDGARPLVTATLIDDTVDALRAAKDIDGLIVGQPSYDTLKEVESGVVIGTPDRSRYWAVQTPQVFRSQALRAAHAAATADPATDDATLVEAIGGTVRVFEGPRDNIKVTVAEDLAIAEAILSHRGIG